MWSLFVALALADAIEPEPQCPPGAVGVSSHCGAWCEPATCPTLGCPDGQACEPVGLCIVTEVQNASCGMMPDPRMVPVDKVVGTCAKDADCNGNGRCVTATRCVPKRFGGLCGFGTILPVGFGLAMSLGALRPRFP